MSTDKIPKIKIFTDGAVKGNPGGPGGYAAVLIRGDKKRTIVGFDPKTTNNRMELRAAIAGILALHRRCRIEIWTDSEYLHKGMTQWVPGWKKRSWKTRDGKDVANQDMWSFLSNLELIHDITWKWVRGHTGSKWNEKADRLAGKALKRGIKQMEAEALEKLEKEKLETQDSTE